MTVRQQREAEMLELVGSGAVELHREHTEDPARFYRHQWFVHHRPASVRQRVVLDALAADLRISVGFGGIMGTGSVTARLSVTWDDGAPQPPAADSAQCTAISPTGHRCGGAISHLLPHRPARGRQDGATP